MKTEPLFSVAWIVAAATAVITLLTSFGLNLTADQTAAVLGVVAVAGQVIVALVGRTKVTPNDKVVETVQPDGTRVAGEASPMPTGTVLGQQDYTTELNPPEGEPDMRAGGF